MTWLLANPRLVAQILGGLAIAGILAYGVHRYNDWIRAPLKAKLTECRDNNKRMLSDIEKQNKAVEELKADAEKRKAISARQAEQAGKSAAIKFKQADDIMASPPLKDDKCESARLRLQQAL